MFSALQTSLQYRNLPAWIVLIVCLALLLLAQNTLHNQVEAQATQAFNKQAQNSIDVIVSRLKQHEQILLGGAGLFNASKSVERAEWQAYVERLQLSKNYFDMRGVGYSQVIQPADLSAAISNVRAEGFPQFNIHPPGERSLYTLVIYLEPLTGDNRAALGYDMMSEPAAARAMRLAVNENRTSISGKITLVSENSGKAQVGFLLYVPIYRKHMPLETAAQRWAALQGYVYSPYHMNDLMQDILGQYLPLLDIRIFDGVQVNNETEMYVSTDAASVGPAAHEARYTTSRTINAYGHVWTVNFKSRPEFEANFQSSFDWPLLILGSSTSVMVFLLISLLTIRNIKAAQQTRLLELLVRERTHDLREALDLQTAVLDNAAYSIIATTPEGRITLFNKTAERLLGYSAQEMIGKQTLAILHDAREVANRAQLFSDELTIQLEPGFEVFVAKTRLRLANEHEWIYVRKDRSRFPVLLSVTALRNEQDQITGFIGIATDITTNKVAKQALVESAHLTQTILENVADGIITLNQQGLVQSFNQSAEGIFGYTASEVMGQNISMLTPEPTRSEHDAYLKKYYTTGLEKLVGVSREVPGLRKNGTSFPLDIAVSRSTFQGQPLYIVLVRDITERKHIDKMKSEFVSTISHELRTPLIAINGSLGLLTDGALGELPAPSKQMIELAHKNVLRLTTLISDLLDMEKLVAGKMHFDFKTHALLPLIEQSLQNIQNYAQQFAVHFELIKFDENIFVRVDAVRLQQVLTNFLSNAAKFSPRNGRVEIRLRQQHNHVRVEVIDHGPGITEEFRSRVFQKFPQADASDSRQQSGLGLNISKHLIERMHGHIGFDSEPGKGACFYFELPVIKNQITEPDTEFNKTPGAPHVLVVEDEPDIGRLFAIMLSNAGYNVDIAKNAETAWLFLSQRQYDAMTLDLMLPDKSGLHLMQQIRCQPGTEKLPIIVISAYLEDNKLAIKRDFRIIDWLEKPVSSQQLITAMNRVLPGNKNAATE